MNQELMTLLKRLSILAGLFLVALLVISAVERRHVSTTKSVSIRIEPLEGGHFLIDSADIQKAIDRSFGYPLKGQQLALINVERLERVLEADPFVESADVYVNAKTQIRIIVRQREPILRIIDKNGLNYYLDEVGAKMPLSQHFSARVLAATGDIPPHVPDFQSREKHLLNDLFALTQRIREDELLSLLVEQVHVQNGSFVLIPKLGRQKIVFGPYKNVEAKINKLKLFYFEALPYKGWRKYKTINLKFDGQVVCEKR